LNDQEILDIITSPANTEKKAKTLIDKANEHGGNDNISVIVVNTGAKISFS
jgi:protein phosphatase